MNKAMNNKNERFYQLLTASVALVIKAVICLHLIKAAASAL